MKSSWHSDELLGGWFAIRGPLGMLRLHQPLRWYEQDEIMELRAKWMRGPFNTQAEADEACRQAWDDELCEAFDYLRNVERKLIERGGPSSPGAPGSA